MTILLFAQGPMPFGPQGGGNRNRPGPPRKRGPTIPKENTYALLSRLPSPSYVVHVLRLCDLYVRRMGLGSHLLPGLGGFLSCGKVDEVVCSHCGHTQLFAEARATQNLRSQPEWMPLLRP